MHDLGNKNATFEDLLHGLRNKCLNQGILPKWWFYTSDDNDKYRQGKNFLYEIVQYLRVYNFGCENPACVKEMTNIRYDWRNPWK